MPESQLQHHKYGASGFSAIMACPGKLCMEEGKPDDSSPEADKGSAAHFLAATCLLNGKMPSAYLHMGIVCWEKPGERDGQCLYGESLPEGAVERSLRKIDREMVDNVTGYVEYVRKAANGGTLLVEQRVEFGTSIGLPGAFGTADAIVLSADGTELTIIDYKNGYTVVDVEYNPQLSLYAIGALNNLSEDAEFTTEELDDYADYIETFVLPTKAKTDEFTQEEMDEVLKIIDPSLFEKPKRKPEKVKEIVEVNPCTVRITDDFDYDFGDFELEGDLA